MFGFRPLQVLGIATILASPAALTGCSGDGSSTSSSSAVTSQDSTTTAATPAVSSAPTPTAAAPLSLQGIPPTVVVANSAYKFQPTASSTGQVLTYTITGTPKWARFDSKTGVLSGTPGVSDEGFTGHISITASNGTTSATLAPFTINVISPEIGGGEATLSWMAPTQNEDGSPVTNLAGYYIFYGTDAGALTSTVTVSAANTTSYTIKGLASGAYYFTVVAYNSLGSESDHSDLADHTI